MRSGYTKIEKTIIDSEIGSDPVALGLFLYLAIMANWASYNGLKQGQTMITIKELSRIFGLSRRTVANRIAKMEQTGIISRERIGNLTIFRIEKYISFSASEKAGNGGKNPFDF